MKKKNRAIKKTSEKKVSKSRNLVIVFTILVLAIALYTYFYNYGFQLPAYPFNSPNLLGHYSFDGNVLDSSWSHNNGEIIGLLDCNSAGIIGQACKFSGDSSVALNNLNVNSTNRAKTSVAFLMYWDGTDGVMTLGWGNSATGERGFSNLYFSKGYFGISSYESGILGISSSNLKNKWVYVVAVFSNDIPSASNSAIYLNGIKQNLVQQIGINSGSVEYATVSNSLQIGSSATGMYKFSGMIDDFRVFNIELSQNDALELYKEL